MLGGVPNFSFTIGYVNASWTLRADMVSKYMVKLWKTGVRTYAPVPPEVPSTRPILDLDAGYVKRGGHRLPRQGEKRPWQYIQNYLVEIPTFNFGDQRREMAFDDDVAGILAGASHAGAATAEHHPSPTEALAERA